MASLRMKTSSEVRGADMEVIEMGTPNMVDTTAGESKWGGGMKGPKMIRDVSRARGQSSRACADPPPRRHQSRYAYADLATPVKRCQWQLKMTDGNWGSTPGSHRRLLSL